MKLPSLFRSQGPMRFDVKPRYWDPVKEEIEQRTSRIKRDLEIEGKLTSDEIDLKSKYESGIRGAFTQNRNKSKSFESGSNASTAMLRTIIFFFLLGGGAGYIYLGPIIFQYLLIFGALIGGIYFMSKLKRKRRDE